MLSGAAPTSSSLVADSLSTDASIASTDDCASRGRRSTSPGVAPAPGRALMVSVAPGAGAGALAAARALLSSRGAVELRSAAAPASAGGSDDERGQMRFHATT